MAPRHDAFSLDTLTIQSEISIETFPIYIVPSQIILQREGWFELEVEEEEVENGSKVETVEADKEVVKKEEKENFEERRDV
jgi:hypothetical protein